MARGRLTLMARPEFFHMQLHPEKKPTETVEFAKKGLTTTGAIGLDFGAANHALARRHLVGKPLSSFNATDCKALWPGQGNAARLMQLCALQIGSVGLVRGGQTPVALVGVIGPSFYSKGGGKWGWYRYRFPVQILGWYDEDRVRWPDIRFTPPAQGTFQLLKRKSETRKAIEKW